MKGDQLDLGHSLECAEKKGSVKDGKDRFRSDPLIQDAVLRNLQIMAESCQRLSQPLKERHPEMDWKRLAGFRNILVHDYLGMDLDMVWALVNQKLSGFSKSAKSEMS